MWRWCSAIAIAACAAPWLTACECGPAQRPPTEDGATEERAAIEAIVQGWRFDWDEAERAQAIADGSEVLSRHECNRCHAIDDVEPAGRALHCTSCHRWLTGMTPDSRHYRLLSSRYGQETIERYQRNIEHYLEVPDLGGVARRLRPAWIESFVTEPFDLRPMMDEAMVRTRMPAEDARAIARYFAAVAHVAPPGSERRSAPPPRPSAARLRQGRELFVERCGTCHTFGNLETGRTAEDLARIGLPAQLAPNLRFAKDRMDPEVALGWILSPADFAEHSLMPDPGLDLERARLVRDFLWHADPELLPTPEAPSTEPPPPAEREVGWAEVKERVLGFVCVHCHMNDHERDQGPGNVGGYGWPGSRLRMRTYEALVHGAVYDGERRSVLVAPQDGAAAPLVAAMMRRRVEELRDRVPPFADHERPPYPDAPPGMPMGLPSIADEDVATVRAWIAAGCPGPTEVTGMPGITDGLLVPDGPIEGNHGCQLRAPSERRPEWSTQPPPPWARDDD